TATPKRASSASRSKPSSSPSLASSSPPTPSRPRCAASRPRSSSSTAKFASRPSEKISAKKLRRRPACRFMDLRARLTRNPERSRRLPVSKIVVVTSGKGGVGKTTTSANIATGIALLGKKTVAIDFDVGLRNLDLVMGCERRVIYDLVNVIKGEAKLQQAVIRDKRIENLFMLPASQTRDKDALDPEGVGRVIEELKQLGFEYIICDSPAGIERGAQMAMYFADEAIVVTNPEVSSVRDSDRVLGLLNAKTSRAENGGEPIKTHLLLTRYSPQQVMRGE